MTPGEQAQHYREALELIVEGVGLPGLGPEEKLQIMVTAAQAALAGRGAVHPLLERAACRSCGEPIVWIRTKAGKAAPCDEARRMIMTPGGEMVAGHESHFASCPAARQHRKR